MPVARPALGINNDYRVFVKQNYRVFVNNDYCVLGQNRASHRHIAPTENQNIKKMSKKIKNIYINKICSFENLLLAYKKARRGKRDRTEVQTFEFDLEKNIIEIQKDLLNRNYKFGKYRTFNIYEPKERIISSAPFRDRVVHHAICNIIEPFLDKVLIENSFACRIGKGTHKAIELASLYLRKNKYVLKLDIKKFFFTIDHKILYNELSKKITDKYLLNIIKELLSTYKTDSDYYYQFENDTLLDVVKERGLPIGNLTSQLFANYYLNPLDRYVKEELKLTSYIRYMDDILIFSNNKDRLNEVKKNIKNYLQLYRLKLNSKKTVIIHQKNGIKFLGFHLYRNRKRILRENLDRFKKRFKLKRNQYKGGKIKFENILLSLNSWIGFVNKEDNNKIINDILDKIEFISPNKNSKFGFII